MHRAHVPLLLAALVASVATSAPAIDLPPTVTAQVVLHNAGEAPFTVVAERPLDSPICALVTTHREVLGTIEWGGVEEIVLPPHENRPVLSFFGEGEGCTVARLQIPGVGTRIVVADVASFQVHEFPMTYESLGDVEDGVIVIAPGTAQPLRPTSPDLVFEEPAPLPTCPRHDATLWWRTDYQGPATILEREDDGACTTLWVEGVSGHEHRVEVCANDAIVPFDAGDEVVISEADGRLSIAQDAGDASRGVWLVTSPYALPFGLGLAPGAYARFGCIEDSECPEVAAEWLELRRAGFDGALAELEAGDTLDLAIDGQRVQMWVGSASSTLTTACAGRIEATLVVSER